MEQQSVDPDAVAAREKVQPHISGILKEMSEAETGHEARRRLMEKIEQSQEDAKRKLISHVANIEIPGAGITQKDVVPLSEALDTLSPIDALDLLIHSPGGEGPVAETIVELCRNAVSGQFRVIVPNLAKSAATLIALGADVIVMGPPSELGPIDPQVFNPTAGYPISAQDFIDARNKLEKRMREAECGGAPMLHLQQQMAALDIPFTEHCEKLLEFSRELAEQYLKQYMLQGDPKAAEKAAQTATNLCAASLYKVHGRRISAQTIKNTENLHIKVEALEESSPLWKSIWGLYVRSEVYLSSRKAAKLWETTETSISVQ